MGLHEMILGTLPGFQLPPPMIRRCSTNTPIIAPLIDHHYSQILIDPLRRVLPASSICHFARRQGDDGDNEENLTIQQRIDNFLDTPIFDPDKVLSEIDEQDDSDDDGGVKISNPVARWFATLVQNDYETAEALYAAGFISFMVILTQELLRYVMFGDAYVPFQRGGGGGFGSGFKY